MTLLPLVLRLLLCAAPAAHMLYVQVNCTEAERRAFVDAFCRKAEISASSCDRVDEKAKQLCERRGSWSDHGQLVFPVMHPGDFELRLSVGGAPLQLTVNLDDAMQVSARQACERVSLSSEDCSTLAMELHRRAAEGNGWR